MADVTKTRYMLLKTTPKWTMSIIELDLNQTNKANNMIKTGLHRGSIGDVGNIPKK